MSALCTGRRLCSAALRYRPPPAGRARNLTRRIPGQLQHCISCYSDGQEGHGRGEQPEAPKFTSPLGTRTWRRRSLSPLDRVSGIIPPEFISQEIRDLKNSELPSISQDQPEQLRPPEPPSSSQDVPEQLRPPSSSQEPGPHGSPEQLTYPKSSPSFQEYNAPSDPYSPPKSSAPQDYALQGNPFQPGDLLIAEYKRRHYSMFRKMFVLKGSGKLVGNWGAINNKDLLGRLPGEKIRTSTGHLFILRRPSLDEYVIYMKRGPTISYPKDIASMLLMMDVNPGDVILEAGSGSGALSLFLSRAVGSEGYVHSIEVRYDHHQISKRNFLNWKKAWELRSGRIWPDNVNFIHKDVQDAMSDLKSVGFDAVALDMLHPQTALPAVVENLKYGAVCAVYITNITQVIDLLEGIRTCELPLICEKVMEVGVTDWLVAPSLRKDGTVSKRIEPQWNGSSETQTQEQTDDNNDDNQSQTDDDDFVVGSKPFGQVPYIARPMPWQIGHTVCGPPYQKYPTDLTPRARNENYGVAAGLGFFYPSAFLVQLRKIKAAAEYTEPGDSS